MSRVITVSQTYPSYHPRVGEKTNFVEKIWESLLYLELVSLSRVCELSRETGIGGYNMNNIRNINFQPKFHTIRAGHRWKAGDKFSPRVWGSDINPKSGRSGPYHSKQIIIAPDIEVKKVWHIEVRKGTDTGGVIYVDGSIYSAIDAMFLYTDNEMCENLKKLANNDGLSSKDLVDWFKFPKPFSGQIISWSDSISY